MRTFTNANHYAAGIRGAEKYAEEYKTPASRRYGWIVQRINARKSTHAPERAYRLGFARRLRALSPESLTRP